RGWRSRDEPRPHASNKLLQGSGPARALCRCSRSARQFGASNNLLQARLSGVTGAAVVGYPGPVGSHSGAASLLLGPEGSSHEPLASFIAVVEAAVAAEVSLGVLPIENSLHGPVAETHDLLYEAPLSIVSEVTLPIVHC